MPTAAASQLLHPNANLPEPVPAKRRGRPSKQLLLEQELQESDPAQSQRSEASVAVIEAGPADFMDDMFEAKETPLSEAAAVWEDLVEVSCLLSMALLLMAGEAQQLEGRGFIAPGCSVAQSARLTMLPGSTRPA